PWSGATSASALIATGGSPAPSATVTAPLPASRPACRTQGVSGPGEPRSPRGVGQSPSQGGAAQAWSAINVVVGPTGSNAGPAGRRAGRAWRAVVKRRRHSALLGWSTEAKL